MITENGTIVWITFLGFFLKKLYWKEFYSNFWSAFWSKLKICSRLVEKSQKFSLKTAHMIRFQAGWVLVIELQNNQLRYIHWNKHSTEMYCYVDFDGTVQTIPYNFRNHEII